MTDALRDCQLYLLSPPHIELPVFAAQLEEALAASPLTATGERRVGAFQLRLENASEAEWRKAVTALQPICARYDTPLVLNEHVELALELDADGVHLTEQGTSVAKARHILGDERIIGKSCAVSRDTAMKAGEEGADYVLFSSFYPSDPVEAAQPDLLTWWQEFFVLPCVAAGGITPENCCPLILAGADFVMASIWHYPQGPAAAVAAFDVAITEALQNP